MNINDAKNIDIVSFLSKRGISPVRTNGTQYLYLSPFRNEANPSFSVSIKRNKWYDFGLGEGGDVISLVRKLHNANFREASEILVGQRYSKFTPQSFSSSKKENTSKITKSIDTIESSSLISYLNERRVSFKIVECCNELFEVEYCAKSGKLIAAIGFKNDKGGFELRNNFLKLSTSPKAITTIHGAAKELNVFEGFMDYLSALTYYNTSQLEGTSIILNGVGQKKDLMEVIHKYDQVTLYLDNDKAGYDLVNQVHAVHSNVRNMGLMLYPTSKDFNEFLVNRKRAENYSDQRDVQTVGEVIASIIPQMPT